MNIAYIGTASGTSIQRANALRRLGHNVSIIDPWAWLHKSKYSTRFHFHTGYVFSAPIIENRVYKRLVNIKPDCIWVNQGEFLRKEFVHKLRNLSVPIINYANDNPFARENRIRFRNYRKALPYYDLVVVVFEDAVEKAISFGARKVVRKFITADEVAHLSLAREIGLGKECHYNVTFVGTWMREFRGAFITDLIRLGVPVSVWGDHWHKDPQWKVIKPHWKGPGVYDEVEYARILASSKICLGLLNKSAGNLHTDRSIQIPALGSVLCAERTSEHLMMYKDGEEAVFWDDPEECANLCEKLLMDDSRREEIAKKGRARCIDNNLFNEPVMESILKEAFVE